jgi:hypothetical protein
MVGGVETSCHTRLPSLNYAGSNVQPSVITHSLTQCAGSLSDDPGGKDNDIAPANNRTCTYIIILCIRILCMTCGRVG